MTTAARLANELYEALGIDAELVGGDNGIFDVVVDGKTVFSKFATGRFPDMGEIPRILRNE